MRKPEESLDDYIVTPPPEVTTKPPRSVWLWRTGKVEVLKPLTNPEDRVRRGRTVFTVFRPNQPLWFRRFLAVGSGALVMMAFVLVSAILVQISEPVAGPDVATTGSLDDNLTQADDSFSSEVPPAPTFESATDGVDIIRSNIRRMRARPRAHLNINKPRRRSRPSPQAELPKFIPTTLVIYAENGVINTRIEPWFQAGEKKPPNSYD